VPPLGALASGVLDIRARAASLASRLENASVKKVSELVPADDDNQHAVDAFIERYNEGLVA
jgi:hypothetical protein